ncbi:hypothetical protein R6Q57_011991 [Mikania cordata]
MGNVKSIWSKGEEHTKTDNVETSSGLNSTFDVKSQMSEETVSKIIDVETVSEEVGKTAEANGEASKKKKKKKTKNKKLATSAILNPFNNIEDTKIANCGQQVTNCQLPNVETSSGLNSTFDVKSQMSEETVSKIIDVETVSEEVGKTAEANGEASKKKKKKKTKNKKLATSAILNPFNNIEDTKIANIGQQETNCQLPNVETSSGLNSTFDVKSQMSKEIVYKIIDVETVSEEVGKTAEANGEASKKKKKKKTKNKKLATSAILNPFNNIEDTKIANCGQQETNCQLPTQSQVNDGQQMDTNTVKTFGNVKFFNGKDFVTRSKKILLILDVNGLLADVINPPPKNCKPDIKISRRAIFKRPFLDDFLGFCFERFDVAIWSSRTRKILDPIVDYLLGDLKKNLVFVWDSSHCTNSSVRSLENHYKFIVFKKLGKIWEENSLIASENGYYNDSNTLLLDDSPYKALLNPKHTGIFPLSYTHKELNDNSLGPDGDLRIYLEGVAASDNVKTYVEQHPFGQRPIDETGPDWGFYSEVLKKII